MTDRPEDRAVISGLGMSRIGRKLGQPALELTLEACRAAIADAGLEPSDIDGIGSMGDTPVAEVVEALRLVPASSGARSSGRGGLLAPVFDGIDAVASGAARHVLVYRTVQMLGGSVLDAPGQPAGGGEGAAMAAMSDVLPLLTHHAYSASNWVAMHCMRHMHLYGTTREQLGHLAVNSRRNAALNPLAVFREPMTLDDHLSARRVSDPLGLLDCDVPVDGSIALVVSTVDHAADCPNPVVGIEATGTASGAGGWFHRLDYPAMAADDAAADLWARTDLRPTDVDLAEVYDGFTFLALSWLEALGFCGRGESGPFVDGGTRIRLDGELPLNTYGGQLSAGRMHGYWVVHEACLQLRHQAADRQVARAEVAAVAAGGGPIAGCMLLTRR